MTREILHPLMMERLADLFPSAVTVQAKGSSQGGWHEPTGSWADVAGIIGLSCRCAPNGGREVKLADQTYAVSDFTIIIPEAVAGITERMKAVVSGTNAGTYDILTIQTDGQGTVTRLMAQKLVK